MYIHFELIVTVILKLFINCIINCNKTSPNTKMKFYPYLIDYLMNETQEFTCISTSNVKTAMMYCYSIKGINHKKRFFSCTDMPVHIIVVINNWKHGSNNIIMNCVKHCHTFDWDFVTNIETFEDKLKNQSA
jgi:hypothetical protein